jgi:hypothetical protein
MPRILTVRGDRGTEKVPVKSISTWTKKIRGKSPEQPLN